MTTTPLDPCDFREPHQDHVQPGGLASYCPGMASEFPSQHTHTAACANRRLTDRVMGLPFRCACVDPCDHVEERMTQRRPGEGANEFTGRYLGERRDV